MDNTRILLSILSTINGLLTLVVDVITPVELFVCVDTVTILKLNKDKRVYFIVPSISVCKTSNGVAQNKPRGTPPNQVREVLE
jgi:hypothetical protein